MRKDSKVFPQMHKIWKNPERYGKKKTKRIKQKIENHVQKEKLEVKNLHRNIDITHHPQ